MVIPTFVTEGYAFEQKLNDNTKGVLNKKIGDYKQAEEEAMIPLMFFNSVITRDGREMVISTHPARFLMQPLIDSVHITSIEPDAVDFTSFFQKPGSFKSLCTFCITHECHFSLRIAQCVVAH